MPHSTDRSNTVTHPTHSYPPAANPVDVFAAIVQGVFEAVQQRGLFTAHTAAPARPDGITVEVSAEPWQRTDPSIVFVSFWSGRFEWWYRFRDADIAATQANGGGPAISTPSTITTCGCSHATHPQHDKLLDLFTIDTPDAARRVVTLATTWEAYNHDRSQEIPWTDWEQFVSEHNWPDPAATSATVTELVHIVGRLMRCNDLEDQAAIAPPSPATADHPVDRRLAADALELMRHVQSVVARASDLQDKLAAHVGVGVDVPDEMFDRSGATAVFDALYVAQSIAAQFTGCAAYTTKGLPTAITQAEAAYRDFLGGES